MQTHVATTVLESLSEKLDGEITVEKTHLKPFTTLVLKNTVILDKNPPVDPVDSTLAPVDTFFRAEYIIAKFSLESLLDKESIKITSVYVGNAQMNLVLEDIEMKNGEIELTNNLSRIFRIPIDGESSEPSPKELFRIRDVMISDMGFSLKNRGRDKLIYYGGINWDDLDITSIRLSARGLRFENGIMYGTAESLSFKEKSGFDCKFLSGKTRVGRGKTIVEDIILKDPYSDLDVPLYAMTYDNVESFSDFIGKVRIDGVINTSLLDFRTLQYFAPQLGDNKIRATVSGIMSGCVDDFIVRNVDIDLHQGNFKTTVNGRIQGIPDVYAMNIDADLTRVRMSVDGLGKFISEWIPQGELDLSRFESGSPFYGKISAHGLLNNFKANAHLASEIGSLSASATLSDIITPDKPIGIEGAVDTENINLGRILNTTLIGPTSLHTEVALKIDDSVALDVDALNIENMVLNNYEYRDIYAKGRYDSTILNGTIISKDPNLNFIFQGGYAKSEKSQNTVYKFDASIGHADLNAINIDKRGKSIIQLRTNANFTQTRRGNILGRIDIGEIMLENKAGRFDIGNIIITSHSTNNRYQARLHSSFADATYTGTESIDKCFNDFYNIILKNEMPSLSNGIKSDWKGDNYEVGLTCHNMQSLLAFAAPGLYIEEGTSLKAGIDNNGYFNADMSSGRIAYKRNFLKGIDMTFDNSDGSLNGEMKCDEIAASKIFMKDNIFKLHLDENHFGAGFSFDNHNETEARGELIVNGEISKEEESLVLDINIKPSSFHYDSKEWNIQQSNIRLHSDEVSIDSFGVISGEQAIGLFGKISDKSEETLTLNLERFDLSVLNALIPSDFGISGAVTGVAQLKSALDNMEITADIICDSTRLADISLGEVNMATTWNEQEKRFDIMARNNLQGYKNLDIKAHYTPASKKIFADAKLDRLNIGYVQPLMTDIFSEMQGSISGELTLDGTTDRPVLRSNNATINDATLAITYTGVPYHVNGPFHIDETGVYFDDIYMRDNYDGNGSISGGILYDCFKDITFDTRISVNRIEAINLKENEGDVFYGKLFGSGNLSITGPINAIVLDIDAVTSKSGELHIPVTSSLTSQKGTNLLRFKELDNGQKVDPYEIFVQTTDKESMSESDFIVRLKVNAQPDVETFVEIDKASGNVLSGRGSGNISMEVSEDIFNINGDYTLNSGNYRFQAMGLVGKDFSIQDGSSIRFNGDIMESTLDINAIYRTKASLSTLISDTTSVSTRRVVDCGIGIKDKLMSPQLSFSIEIPDLDPTIKSRVESALSTEDKVQKQFLALIISNNFIPDEQSGIVNNTSALYSSVSEMMSNQINNIFQKLNIPLDLGLNYQPNERGNDLFDVAVTTQLFNNRVIVNGNIGNRQYSSGSDQNEVAGDIEIEIKLDRSGAFRLNLFSHSADQYTNYLENSQRNGVGITYQTEFNSFKKFIRNIFSSKAKRTMARLMEEDSMLNEKRVTVEVQRPVNKSNE